MTQQNKPRFTRRQVLAGLGTIGVASAGAGLGTTAFYSDRESLEGWLEAGRVDLILDYRSTYKPWERYDLHMVPQDERPPIVRDTDGMTYELSACPSVRYDEDGESLTHDDWAALVTQKGRWADFTFEETDFTVDPCKVEDATDMKEIIEEFAVIQSEGQDTVFVDPDMPGYVDGQDNGDNEPVMFIDLDDIKPYDEGETTFSLHLCGNPSFLSARLGDMLDLEDEDGTENPIEPELEAGEPVAAGRPDDSIWNGGELADYLYVIVSVDNDCDNRTANSILSDPDVDDAQNGLSVDEDFAVINENVLYAGSLAGWKDLLEDGFELPPSGPGGVGSEEVNGTNSTLITPTSNGTTADAIYKGNFTGQAGGQVNQCIEFVLEECDEEDLEVLSPLLDGLSGFCYDGPIPEGTTHVVLKAGIGCYLAEVDETTTEICLVEPDMHEPNEFGEISNATFFKCEDGNGPAPPPAGGPGGECPKPGAHCYVMEWYLPCKENDPDRLGFTDLPVYNAIDQDGGPIMEQDGDTDGQDDESRLSFNDELRQRGFVQNGNTIDVNVTQTDSCHFTIVFEAEQCRHNTDTDIDIEGECKSDFETDADDWTASCPFDDHDAKASFNSNGLLHHIETGGNPGGYVFVNPFDCLVWGDEVPIQTENLAPIDGAIWAVQNDPESCFLGDKSAFVGGTLAYDLQRTDFNGMEPGFTANNEVQEYDVIIEGSAGSLFYSGFTLPTEWTTHTVDLIPENWSFHPAGPHALTTGSPATMQQFVDVLSDVTALNIRLCSVFELLHMKENEEVSIQTPSVPKCCLDNVCLNLPTNG
ncbi:laminin B domain-containing protein [Haloarchaeobius sp. DYHT-AS-18]|uniref:laminin B domain-containing protein n=1 Tax=Haloarchaeobius sp. DYHT-AS-18 TaxID=3446117 RepID=UPI003EBB0231